MKKLSLILLLLIVFSAFSINASAATAELEDYGLTINLSDDYEYITVANASRKEEIVNKFGYSVKSMKSYMNNNEIILIAINEQTQEQLQVKATETDFSKGVTSLSGLTKDEKNQIAEFLFPSTEYSEKNFNDMPFFVTSAEDAISFSTISGGKLFTVTYYGKNNDAANSIAKGITFKTDSALTLSGGTNILHIVIAAAVTLAALVCCVILVVTLVADFKNRETWKNEDETVIIKRRKR